MKWVEIAAGFQCNLSCVGCRPERAPQVDLPTREVLRHLLEARSKGAESAWFGGGEPTLRPDLVKLVAAARRSGFVQVKLQTNGLRLAHPEYTRALAAAGLGSVNLALRSHLPELHDRLVGRAGAHQLLERALGVLGEAGLALEGDLLVMRANLEHLADTLEHYLRRGVSRFNFWYLCRLDPADQACADQVPPYREAVPRILEAIDRGLALGAKGLTSLHTPACVVPRSHWQHLYFAPDLDMWVVNADGRAFWMEQSPMEGGSPLPGCERCLRRSRCLGPRKDYLELFGPGEFVPIPRE
jgi:hypothetical protein